MFLLFFYASVQKVVVRFYERVMKLKTLHGNRNFNNEVNHFRIVAS